MESNLEKANTASILSDIYKKNLTIVVPLKIQFK
mgnify:CR=1 FL=1